MKRLSLLQKSLSFSLILLIHSLVVFAKPHEFLIVGPASYNPGLFSVFTTVLGLMDHYEKTNYAGLEVNLGNGGCYYEPNKGLNWWNYYFEPVYFGNDEGAERKYLPDNWHVHFALKTLNELSVERCHELIQKYIHVKPQIKNKVSEFVDNHFKSAFIIGVHYRGTDKMILEAPRLSYDAILLEINKLIRTLDLEKKGYKIFLATDEEAFLDYMKVNFPKSLIYTDSFRSLDTTHPIHNSIGNKYQKGEDAVIDCLLLSKCNFLLRTTSNLSLCATYFNPNLPVIMLNLGKFDKK